MTKQDELLKWINKRNYVATHEIMRWGVDNFYDRAGRTKRDFVTLGYLSMLSKWQKETVGYKCKDAVYFVNHNEIKNYFEPSLF